MYIAGIDIGGSSVKLGILDTDKGIVWRTQVLSIVNDPEAMADAMASALRAAPYPFERVGVGTAGMVCYSDRTVTTGNLGWRKVPLEEMLVSRLNVPVFIDNDAQAALAAEVYDGACTGEKDVIYLTLGTGIGGAILLNGKSWRGPDHMGGELGHIITHAHGLPCACGRRGCFEAYAAAPALSRILKRSTREAVTAIQQGDADALNLFEEYLDELAIGASSLYMVFKPAVLVLGGGISAIGEPLRAGLQRHLAAQFSSLPGYCDLRVELAQHGNEAGLLGAAALAV